MIIIQSQSHDNLKWKKIIMICNISLPDSELSMVNEGIYANIPTIEIDINISLEYSPTTEPISFSSSIENYLPSQLSNPIQNQIDEAPLLYLSNIYRWHENG